MAFLAYAVDISELRRTAEMISVPLAGAMVTRLILLEVLDRNDIKETSSIRLPTFTHRTIIITLCLTREKSRQPDLFSCPSCCSYLHVHHLYLSNCKFDYRLTSVQS
jgi:hypothetical protein